MDKTDVEKNGNIEETSQLNRNRSFKSKQLVRSQAIRESQSPPRTVSPSVVVDNVDVKNINVDARNVNVDARNVNVDARNVNVDSRNVNVDVKSVNVNANVNVELAVDALSSPSDERSDGNSFSDCNEDCRKKQQVEIQITSGTWDEPQTDQRQRTKRWLGYRQHSRDLLSNNPRVACVCGGCTACPHCRGRRRRHLCPTKQDSGIVCSDDCPDCSDSETTNGSHGKASSVDADETHCRCPDRRDRPRSVALSRTDSDDKSEPTGAELVMFIKQTLNKNARDRVTLLKIEKELHSLVSDPGRCIVRFPVMTSYGRMLVHRCAALFQLCHHLDHNNKGSVLVSKSGTSGGRIPCTNFKQWCTTNFPPSPQRHQPDLMHAKSILKRDTHSLDEPGAGSLNAARSKSLEQRERDYERVRRRIFSTDNCSQDESQWQWMNAGPIKLLTGESGRNKLLKVQSLEGSSSTTGNVPPSTRGAVSKSHSFGGYGRPHDPPRVLSRQGDLASSSWRLSPSSSGYRTLSLHSTDSVTPSPTGGGSPEPSSVAPEGAVVWAVTDMSAVPPGALVIHPQTGRPLTNPDGSVYHFDPTNPPVISDHVYITTEHNKNDTISDKKRGRLEKQQSFMDNECECRPSEECRSKSCCDCQRQDSCKSGDAPTQQMDQKVTKIPTTPTKTRHEQPPEQTNQIVGQEPPTNHRPTYEAATNQKPTVEVAPSHSYNPSPNQRPPFERNFEPPNQRAEKFETQRPQSFDSVQLTNQRAGNEVANHRPARSVNHVSPEVQYISQQFQQGFAQDEATSPPQPTYVHHEMGQAMAQIKPMPMPEHNIRPMSLGVMYPPVQYGYPPMPLYQQVVLDDKQVTPAHHNDTGFRIDPSYPYAAVDYSSCTACEPRPAPAVGSVPNVGSVPSVGAVPTVGSVPAMGGVVPIEQLQCPPFNMAHHYGYQDNMQWQGVMQPKLVVPDMYPLLPYNVPVYQPQVYNYLYPHHQVLPQHYQVCQPVYQQAERQDLRRNSASQRHSKRNSISGSSRNTPLQTPPEDKKVPYEEHNPTRQSNPTAQTHPTAHTHPTPQSHPTAQTSQTRDSNEIAVKIQQIKDQMAQLNTRDRDRRTEWRGREDFKRRNSGNGILGSYPVNSFNGRVIGRTPTDEAQLNSAARAIVNSIRHIQAKNNYTPERRDMAGGGGQYRGEWRRRDDKERDDRRQQYRPDYLLRQMSPGTWCRRSPGPLHPVLNQQPRRPHPDTRNGRR